MEIDEIDLFLPNHITKMGWRLPIEVVNQIKLYLNLDEHVPDIAVALKVSKMTVYKLQLNCIGKISSPANGLNYRQSTQLARS